MWATRTNRHSIIIFDLLLKALMLLELPIVESPVMEHGSAGVISF